MKYLKLLLIVVTGILAPTCSWASLDGFARISLMRGDVQIRHENSSEWYPASVNTPLCEGDGIWSPDGARVEVQLQNGSFVRLDSMSSLDILALREDLVQMHVGMGRAYVRTAAMGDRALQLDLNDSSVLVYDKARIRIDLTNNGDEDISLLKGEAFVDSDGRRTPVRAGEMLSIGESDEEILPLNPPDEWERWNSGRDRAFFARWSGPDYLPEELAAYRSDFDNNGSWVYVPEYGYVWRPTVISGPDWSPYQVGRWVWIGGDYVWVSHETWGWAPYHYGRWVSISGAGWCWVPPTRGDVYWAPGYVGWVSTPQYVGWVPLAPGEKYYGRGNYGRNSVNLTQVNVRNITVNKVIYRNVNVVNAVTIVNRNSFASGNASYEKPRENIFLKADVHFGRPDIKPARTAMMPALKTVSQSKTPPPAIRNIRFGELRERHPRMDGSLPVAKPGTAVARPEDNGTRLTNPWSRHRPESHPEAAGFPAAADRQKTDKPQSRTWQEANKSGQPATPPPQKPGRSADNSKGANTMYSGDTKSFSPYERQKEKPAVSTTPPVKMSGGVDQTASAGNVKKPYWPGLSNKGQEQRKAVPPGTRGPKPEVRTPAAKTPPAPGAPQKAANQTAGPQQKADRKVWKVRTTENGNGEEKKENKKSEKEQDKP